MKRRDEIKTHTFEADYGFMVDIVEENDKRCGEALWSVFLYREGFGVKMHMFGLPKHLTPTIEEAINIVEGNLPEYYGDYDDEYAQYDNVDRSYEDDDDDDDDEDEDEDED